MMVGLGAALLVIPGLGFVSFNQGDSGSLPVVTIRHPACTVDAFVEDLRRSSGIQIVAKGKLRDDVVLVDMKRPENLGALMSRLAKCLNAKWSFEKDTWTLSEDAALVAMKREKALTTRAAAFAKNVGEISRQALKVESFDQAAAAKLMDGLTVYDGMPPDARGSWERFEGLRQQSPQGRLLLRFLSLVPPRDVAALEQGANLMYSTSPTAVELPLGSEGVAILQRAIKEFAVWERYLENNPSRVKIGGDPREASGWTSAPVKVLLHLRNQGFGRLTTTIYVVGSDGSTLSRTSMDVTLPWDVLSNNVEAATLAVNPDFTFTEDSKIWCRFYGLLPGDQLFPAANDRLIEQAITPSLRDPHSFATQEALRALAGDRNLICSLPDPLLKFPETIARSAAFNRAQLMRYLKTRMDLAIEEDANWISLRPSDQVALSPGPLIRQAATKLLTALRNNAYLSIEDLGAFAQRNGFYQRMPIVSNAVGIVAFWDPFPDVFDWDVYKLYGSLPQALQTKIRGGEEFHVADMPAASQKQLLRCVLVPTATDRRGVLPFAYGDDTRRLPWEILDSGLLPNSEVVTRRDNRRLLISENEKPDGHKFWVRVGEGAAYAATSDRFRFVLVTKLEVTIQLTDTYSYHFTLEEKRLDSETGEMTYDQLPASSRTEVDRLRTKAHLGEGGQGRPPPNPR